LIERSRRPIGISLEGSDETKSLKPAFEPSYAKLSNFFSSSIKKPGMRWIF